MKNKKEKIGVYGLLGSYTDQAIKEILKKKNISTKNIDFVELPEASDLMNFMKKGNLIILPIENSTGGTVTQFLDLFPKYDFEIIYEYFMPINHCLLAKKGIKKSDIKKVYSHPQSLLQCSKFLAENKFSPIADSDNSAAAQTISKMDDKNVASIGGEILADIYDLKILQKKVQNSKNNTTKFLIAKKARSKNIFENKIKNKNPKKTTLIFETKNITGALYKCLGAFATNGINLSKIESRPAANQKNFNYFFLIEFAGNTEDKNVKDALVELDFFTENIKIFGSY